MKETQSLFRTGPKDAKPEPTSCSLPFKQSPTRSLRTSNPWSDSLSLPCAMVYHQTTSQALPLLNCSSPLVTSQEHHPRHQVLSLQAFGRYSNASNEIVNTKTTMVFLLYWPTSTSENFFPLCVTNTDLKLTSSWHCWCHLIALCHRSYFITTVVCSLGFPMQYREITIVQSESAIA